MSIEKDLGRIADALESLVEMAKNGTEAPAKPAKTEDIDLGLGGAAPAADTKPARTAKPKAAAGAAAPAAAPGETAPTKDDLVDQLRALVTAKGPEIAKKLLQKYGAGKISDLAETNYAAIYKEMKAAANG